MSKQILGQDSATMSGELTKSTEGSLPDEVQGETFPAPGSEQYQVALRSMQDYVDQTLPTKEELGDARTNLGNNFSTENSDVAAGGLRAVVADTLFYIARNASSLREGGGPVDFSSYGGDVPGAMPARLVEAFENPGDLLEKFRDFIIAQQAYELKTGYHSSQGYFDQMYEAAEKLAAMAYGEQYAAYTQERQEGDTVNGLEHAYERSEIPPMGESTIDAVSSTELSRDGQDLEKHLKEMLGISSPARVDAVVHMTEDSGLSFAVINTSGYGSDRGVSSSPWSTQAAEGIGYRGDHVLVPVLHGRVLAEAAVGVWANIDTIEETNPFDINPAKAAELKLSPEDVRLLQENAKKVQIGRNSNGEIVVKSVSNNKILLVKPR